MQVLNATTISENGFHCPSLSSFDWSRWEQDGTRSFEGSSLQGSCAVRIFSAGGGEDKELDHFTDRPRAALVRCTCLGVCWHRITRALSKERLVCRPSIPQDPLGLSLQCGVPMILDRVVSSAQTRHVISSSSQTSPPTTCPVDTLRFQSNDFQTCSAQYKSSCPPHLSTGLF
eukprot:746073-Hanusia_phi.AAC.3